MFRLGKENWREVLKVPRPMDGITSLEKSSFRSRASRLVRCWYQMESTLNLFRMGLTRILNGGLMREKDG